MPYIYHGKPEEMRGNNLIPLNRLLEVDSNLQVKYLEKYKGREEILERKIPLLNCLWNDVVQLLPLHPLSLFELQKHMRLIPEIPDYQYFEIDMNILDMSKAVVYFKTAPGEEHATVKWLKDVSFDELQAIPKATREYYASMAGKDEPVFNYQFVPHIVYRGTVDVSSSSIINL